MKAFLEYNLLLGNAKKDEKHRFVFLKKLWGIVLIFLLSTPAFSQEIIISGELRPKIEYRNGVKTLLSKDQSAAFLVTQRSRLNISYKDAKIATLFSVQDVRFWGETPYKQDVPSLVVFAA